MTGFGKADTRVKNKHISVEIRSLNSKGSDVNTRMPGLYREKELFIRNLLVEKLERGKIDCYINVESSEEAKGTQINKSVVKSYYSQLKSIAKDLKEEQNDFLEIIMKLPEVLKTEKEEFKEAEWRQVLKLIESAIKNTDEFRAREGKVLANDLRKRIGLILKLLSVVEEADRITPIREKIKKSIEELVAKEKVDTNRFEQELIYYIEKLDITEEKVRLKTHCDFFLKTMDEKSTGKKLGFISQEIGREINTIGSKANDGSIQKIVVQMKDELEKIKEQLNNVV